MTRRAFDLPVRPGRIRHGGERPQTFAGEAMQAARKAGHPGDSFRSSRDRSRSRFGRSRLTIRAFVTTRRAFDRGRIETAARRQGRASAPRR